MRTTISVVGVAVIATLGVHCQLVGGFEDFSGSVDATPPDPCAVLPTQKADPITGGALVRVSTSDGQCSWIDRTEVTIAEYAKWLKAEPKPAWNSRCGWKPESASDPTNPADSCGPYPEAVPRDPTLPVRCVDWCDALAYCSWAGKRLCWGGQDYYFEPAGKWYEWSAACGGIARSLYPYGDEFKPLYCRVGDGGKCSVSRCGAAPPGTAPSCTSATGALDMIGNVREWIFACSTNDPTGPNDPCIVQGGDWDDQDGDPPGVTWQCFAPLIHLPRNTRDVHTGFRCCGDLTGAEQAQLAAAH